jgi:hypothetical protein
MDLSKFDTAKAAASGALLQLRDPATDAPLVNEAGEAVGILLAGIDSEQYQQALRGQQNRRLAKRGRKAGTLTAEELDADGLDLIVACTLGFQNVVVDGAHVEASPAAARAFYRRFPPFREQADEFIGERSHFLAKSSTTSQPTPSTNSA